MWKGLSLLPVIGLLLLSACNSGGNNVDAGPMVCTNSLATTMSEGLTFRTSDTEVQGCTVVDNPAGGTPARVCQMKTADLSCVGMHPARGPSVNVTLRGCVEAFGINSPSAGLTITFLKENDANGHINDPGYDLMGAPGMQTDKTPAAVIGKTVSVVAPESECKDTGKFEIANIPTETPIVVRVTQQTEVAANRDYVDTYQYNYVLLNEDITDAAGHKITDPMTQCAASACYYNRQVNTVRDATFTVVAHAAGVSVISGSDNLFDGVGQGSIAGEVRDCTSEDKVVNAVVAIDATARKGAYFNVGFGSGIWDIDDAKPEGTRSKTNADGLYTEIGIDTQPGGQPVKIGAMITKSLCPGGQCQCTPDMKMNPAWTGPETQLLGTRTIYVFPDAITIITFDRALYAQP